MATQKKKITVVGAGAFGVSTALYLQRYHKDQVDVLLLDSQPFPSVDSASGNDTSRAIRPDYANEFYAKLGIEAVNAWRTDPVFSGHYRESGRVTASAPGSPFTQKCREVMKAVDVDLEEFGTQNKTANLQKRFHLLGNGKSLDSWDFYYNPKAGWANPRESVISGKKEFERLGGSFIGDATRGLVIETITQGSPPGSNAKPRVIGVKTADGHLHHSDEVIFATGAFTTKIKDLLPGLDTQIHPTGFALAHWKLEPEEMEAWLKHPVVDMYHYGYFFPPDPTTRLMKLGLGITGFTNDSEASKAQGGVGVALANSSLVGTSKEGRIPAIAEKGIRQVLSIWAPTLANKKFFDMKMCWDAMTPDGSWLIDHHPDIDGLSVATGGSGHGFKFLPVIGQYICEALSLVEPSSASSLPARTATQLKEMREKWRWGREGNLNVKDRRVVLQGRPVVDVVEHLEADIATNLHNSRSSKL